MGTRRYLFKDVPGPTVTMSFRVPESAAMILAELIPEAEGIETKSEAMQDAFVKWVMLEELERNRRREAAADAERTGPASD